MIPSPHTDDDREAPPSRWQTVLRHARLGFWSADLPSLRLTVTPQARALLQVDAGAGPAGVPELLGLFADPDARALGAAFDQIAAGGTSFDLECRLAGPAADPRQLRWRAERTGPPGRERIEGTVQDVSEPARVALALQASEASAREAMARVSAVLDAVPDLWFVISDDGRYMEVSRPDHPSLAAPWDATRGRPFAEVIPAPLAALAAAALARARAGGTVERIEYRLPTVGGAERVFEARIAAMADGRWLYLTRDITDAVQAQQALRDSEARLARALRGTSEGLWDWDLRTGRDHLSPRWKAMLGFAPDELTDAEASFFGRLHPDDVGPVQAALQAHFQHGAPYDIELRLRMKDGDWRWFRARGEAERDPDGQPLRMAGGIADITVRRQMEDALRDSQARFSAMVQTVPVGIGLTTAGDGVAVEVNDEMGRILGWPPGEMIGRSSTELGIWPDPAERAAFIAELLRDGRAERPRLLMRHRSGRTVHARLASQRLNLGGSELVLSAITDISDRISAEDALRDQRESYEAIFNAASDAIVSVDERGRILMFNPGAERIFQRSAESLHGRSVDQLLPPAQRRQHHADIAGFSASSTSRRAMGAGRVKGLRADGEELDLEASISKASVAGRTVLTAILRDVTEQVRAEAAGLRHRFELSALTRQLLEQEKHTTQRLAQALHDQLGQTLTALRLVLDRDRRTPATDAAAAAGRREQADALLDQAIQQVRQVLVELRPPLLDEEGLYAALDNEVRSRAALHPDIDLLLEAPAAVQHRRWPGEVEYAVFMIAREAIDNALRHADATLVRVALAGDAASARLEVADDGVGLAPGADRSRPGHLGLIGMRERARAIGAQLSLGAAEEGGTRLQVGWEAPT